MMTMLSGYMAWWWEYLYHHDGSRCYLFKAGHQSNERARCDGTNADGQGDDKDDGPDQVNKTKVISRKLLVI